MWALEATLMPKLRMKFGRNPYTSELTCAHCRERFTGGGLFVRLEQHGKLVDVPICGRCLDKFGLFEGMISFENDNPSFSVGLA